MTKKSTVWLAVMLCMLLPLAAACGAGLLATGTDTNTSTSANQPAKITLPPGENMYVLDGYTPQGMTNAHQRIVVFHPGNVQPAYTLPAGLTSMDHRLLVATQTRAGQTTVSVIDTPSGATLRSVTLAGNYSTAGQEFNNAVVSYDGHWLALRRLDISTSSTTIALIDTQAGKLLKIIHLNGDFDLDAISSDGNGLYLLQRFNNGTGRYYVQLYTVSEKELYQSPIVDKSELNDPNMTGSAVARQMAKYGAETYTLYVDTYHNIAFVHILPLDTSFPFARCITLPVGKSPNLLHYYTLTLSSDGQTLYAANGALGVVSEISLSTGDSNDIYSDQIVATDHFNPNITSVTSDDTSRMLRNSAALSPDQSTLYFAGLHGIWSLKTGDLTSGHAAFHQALTQQSFTSIALSADGKTLYAVDPTSGITAFSVANQQAEQVLQVPAKAPWDIEWMVDYERQVMSAHILIVDDDSRVTSALRRTLAYEGYSVSVAENGERALALARTRQPELVILDLMLPGMNGLEVCRHLRADNQGASVLMLTARDAVADRVAGLETGADDYLVKPFALEELLARVKALLRRRSSPDVRREILAFEDLELDTATRQARRGNRRISLSTTEYELLLLFLRNPRHVLTRGLLMDRIWGDDFEGGPNVLEVYIGHLRNKLEHGGEKRLIQTIRGAGYVLRFLEE